MSPHRFRLKAEATGAEATGRKLGQAGSGGFRLQAEVTDAATYCLPDWERSG